MAVIIRLNNSPLLTEITGLMISKSIYFKGLLTICENASVFSIVLVYKNVSNGNGTNLNEKNTVIPAKAGIHIHQWGSRSWIPAFAEMTNRVTEQDFQQE